jgi:hypothetical protein
MKKSKEMMAALARSIGASAESNEAVNTDSQKAVKTATRPKRGKAKPEVASRREKPQTGTLKQMTVKLAPDTRSRLLQESARRKDSNAGNWPIQDIITEAVDAYLGGK